MNTSTTKTIDTSSATLSYYSIFSGVFLFDESKPINEKNLVGWNTRLSESENLFQHLNRHYYQNFLNNIAPESIGAANTLHYTLPGIYNSKSNITIKMNSGDIYTLEIPYFDLYVFPNGVGIFSFKVVPVIVDMQYEHISNMLNHLRNPQAKMSFNSQEVQIIEFVKNLIGPILTLNKGWDQYLPQLKTYSIIDDLSVKRFTPELDNTLFELSHILRIGSSADQENALSEQYKSDTMNNVVNIYNNWKSLALFDTFTRISCSYADHFRSWENEYFLIYIHSLYAKFKLYSFNSKIKDVSSVNRQTKQLRVEFIEFVNDYHLAYVSYKFLPNLLYDRFNQALEIEKELERMEVKIERIHESVQENKSNQMNKLLFFISLLSIISVVTDLSQWLNQMGVSESIIYSPAIPALMLITMIVTGYRILRG